MTMSNARHEKMIESLLASRIRKVPPSNSNIYEIFPILAANFGRGKLKTPQIVYTYSSACKTEKIRIDQEEYIIYDQYYSQTFNQLNAIRFLDRKNFALGVYADKVLAEELRIRGDARKAPYFGMRYDVLKQGVPGILADIRLEQPHYNLTNVQEIFILAHELAHGALQQDKDTEQGIQRSLAYIEQSSTMEFLRNPKDYIGMYIKSELDLPEDVQQNLEQRIKNQYNEIDWVDLPATKQRMAIEMTCDDLACLFTMSVAYSELKIPMLTIIEAIWLGHLYLWWLHELHIAAQFFSRKQVPDEKEISLQNMLGFQNDLYIAGQNNSVLFQRLRRRRLEVSIYENLELLAQLNNDRSLPHPKATFELFQRLIDEMFDISLDVLKESIDRLQKMLVPFWHERMIALFAGPYGQDYNAYVQAGWQLYVDAATGWAPVETFHAALQKIREDFTD